MTVDPKDPQRCAVPTAARGLRRSWHWSYQVLLTLALFGASAVAILSLLDHAATRRWNRYAAKLRTDGAPLTMQEIVESQTSGAGSGTIARGIEDLAPELDALWQDGKRDGILVFNRRLNELDVFAGVPASAVEPSRQFRDRHRDLLEKVAALRDLPSGRFRLAYAVNPYHTLLPHIPTVDRAVRLVKLDGILNLCDQKLDPAMAAAATMASLASTLVDEPYLVGPLRRMRYLASATQIVEVSLRAGEVEAGVIRSTEAWINLTISHSTLRWGLLGERAMFVDACDALIAGRLSLAWIGDAIAHGVRKPPPAWLPTSVIRENQMMGAEMLTWLIEAGDDAGLLSDAAARVESKLTGLPWKYRLVGVVVGSPRDGITRYHRGVARLRCTRAGLAAERFRLATGRLPNALAELVPEYLDAVPTDPFDAQPMRFKTRDQGIVIYSIADNLVDDGGVVAWKEVWSDVLDVGFRLVKPEHRGLVLVDAPDSDE